MNNFVLTQVETNEFLIDINAIEENSFSYRINNNLQSIDKNNLEELNIYKNTVEMEGRLAITCNNKELEQVSNLLEKSNLIFHIPLISFSKIYYTKDYFTFLRNIPLPVEFQELRNIFSINYVILHSNKNQVIYKVISQNNCIVRFPYYRLILNNRILKITPCLRSLIYNINIEKINKEYSKITIDFRELKEIINQKTLPNFIKDLTSINSETNNLTYQISLYNYDNISLNDSDETTYVETTEGSTYRHKDYTTYTRYTEYIETYNTIQSTLYIKPIFIELIAFSLINLSYEKNKQLLYDITSSLPEEFNT